MRMYLEEIILDGFKSYATRTVISGFDPKFNAITGLNGSGKSNILDAICFVLGITNLSQVGGVGDWRRRLTRSVGAREESAGIGVQAGSGGHNEGDSDSGVQQREDGGESDRVRAIRPDHVTRQVVLGGRNKYLIQGHSAQVNQVQNLFHSVQLNVNNPHFLIMQARYSFSIS